MKKMLVNSYGWIKPIKIAVPGKQYRKAAPFKEILN